MLEAVWKRLRPSRHARQISVVVPLYNHAAYIEPAINSILAQGSIVREIIVIDDGSTDGSALVMRHLMKLDARIVFHSRPNQGAHATINEGVERCAGDFIAILNSDDCFLGSRLEKLADLLAANPGAAIAASALAFMDGSGKPIKNSWYSEALAFYASVQDMGTALVNANFLMTTSNFVIRRSAVDQLGGFAALRYTHDLDYILRAIGRGYDVVICDEPLLRYRIHDSNTIAEDHSKVRAEWAIATAAYLTRLLDETESRSIDWQQAAKMETVLQGHELARAVHMTMAYLRRHGGSDLCSSPLLQDADFKGQIAGWV